MKPESLAQLAQPLLELADDMKQQGDLERAGKLIDLASRANLQEAAPRVAFCGLFSAGKTSLLNALCERNDLATGAIPTTALVTEVVLPNTAVTLLDTPGVDSTDATHQAATEDALHLADAIVLVMDYQQVESDLNLHLAESFMEREKPLFLVINQVDKHVEWELSFDAYKSRVERTFEEFGIEARGVFYTSTRWADHAGLDELKRALAVLANEVDLQDSLTAAVQALVSEHVSARYEEATRQAEQRLMKLVGSIPYDREEAKRWLEDRRAQLLTADESLQLELADWTQKQRALEEEVRRGIDLAQISPYDTTELGRRYIESLRPGFKVGWLSSKTKVVAEQSLRLEQFLVDLAGRTERFMVWPTQSVLRSFLQQLSYAPGEWSNQVEQLQVSITQELCQNQVKNGALISDQYPYQYVKDVVQTVKNRFRATVLNQLDAWSGEQNERFQTLHQERQDVAQWRDDMSAIANWMSVLDDREAEVSAMMRPILNVDTFPLLPGSKEERG